MQKRIIQLELSKLGERFPAEITSLNLGYYKINTLWDIADLPRFISRQPDVFNDISDLSIQGNVLYFSLTSFNEITLDKIAFVLGYEGIILIQNN